MLEEINKIEALRQPCEVFSRVVGYIRPVHQWNKGKQSEYGDRKMLTFSLKNEEVC
ncbi:MAG: Ribonucleoside-triphosphate reductase class III catalytic subunit [candidate division CPR2 bacterium GW2011_GWC1_39_9]|uniref:Anaerobic ribonucleoside-triphosphate reductase n=1 Tax=candidate division CPR2 bacterium GW2011_GWC2_39_10 TaxID=1618345 RepID=A0A0G0LW72_UNCC2|nr:MAG: Anaerobic ribonucleoside-triphosphate reductase [candidate division CPR2 bacterium GW2011_GWC2_39_10]KKR36069.1 MAG: Ribonucleoside-triphosphate reductase class III catalytic subunit [candidate division CPR2 bacterium GW2011_GWC1_39_9]